MSEREQRMPQSADEETVVVNRGQPETAQEETLVVERAPIVDERTVVLDRALPEPGETILPEADEEDDETELVRRPLIEEDTVIVDRGGWLPEGTVRVSRGAPVQGFSGPLAGLSAAPAARGNRFAPPAGGRRAVLGAGAGATSRYTTRRVAAEAPHPAPVVQAGDATRDPHVALPSVRRRARRGAVVSLIAAGAALAVTVGGLAVVVPMLLAG